MWEQGQGEPQWLAPWLPALTNTLHSASAEGLDQRATLKQSREITCTSQMTERSSA